MTSTADKGQAETPQLIGDDEVVPPDTVLDNAKGCRIVLVIGIDSGDKLRVWGSHSAKVGTWLINSAVGLFPSPDVDADHDPH